MRLAQSGCELDSELLVRVAAHGLQSVTCALLVSMTNTGASSLTPWSSVKDQEQGAYVWLDRPQTGPASLYNLINSDWISSPRNIVVSFLFIDKSAETFHHRFCVFGVCLFRKKENDQSTNESYGETWAEFLMIGQHVCSNLWERLQDVTSKASRGRGGCVRLILVDYCGVFCLHDRQ